MGMKGEKAKGRKGLLETIFYLFAFSPFTQQRLKSDTTWIGDRWILPARIS
jgi:hypothetical protein